MAIYDITGSKVPSATNQTNQVLIASSDASDGIKSSADYVCTGTNDEVVIQQAINQIISEGGGRVCFSNGRFIIDSFPNSDNGDDRVALLLPLRSQGNYNIELVGAGFPYAPWKDSNLEGTKIEVSETCYESLSTESHYTLIRSGYFNTYYSSLGKAPCVQITDMAIEFPSNQRKIIGIDCRYMNNVRIERVRLQSVKDGYNGYVLGSAPPLAVDGNIGVRFTSGSNSGMIQYFNSVGAYGFYEGFACGGEHVVCINLYALFCYYGYTFGNYGWWGNFNHNITLINCCDEKNVNLPLFADCGRKEGYNATSTGGPQSITMIDFNMERYASAEVMGGGVAQDFAKEVTPNKFRGTIEYTMMSTLSANSVNVPFWEHGHGHGFVTRNQAHALSGTSAVRRSYAPNYMQSFYDTTVNKMLWCIDTANKTWVDAQGNTVS